MKRPPLLSVAMAPHTHLGVRVSEVYLHQLVALLPAAIGAVWIWGLLALRTILLTVGAVLILEWLTGRLMNRETSVLDGSAAVQGLLLAFLFHAGMPWWLILLGALVMVTLGRQFFGGIGGYPLNPPALAYAVLLLSWPARLDAPRALTGIELGFPPVEALVAWRSFGIDGISAYSLRDLFLGAQVGGLGATFGLLLALGALYLIIRGFIAWRISLAFLAALFATAGIFHLGDPLTYPPPLFQLFSGMAIFVAFFLLTDFTTAPVNPWAQVVYGIGAGLLTVLIRSFGGYPDGAIFAVLLMNLAHPLIDKIRPRVLRVEVPAQ